MTKPIIVVDVRTGFTNYPVPLSPCRGCLKRGKCDGEKYAEQGAYCRDKETV